MGSDEIKLQSFWTLRMSSRNKTLQLLENMGIQGQMVKFIRKLINKCGRNHLAEQTDRLEIPQCKSLSGGN